MWILPSFSSLFLLSFCSVTTLSMESPLDPFEMEDFVPYDGGQDQLFPTNPQVAKQPKDSVRRWRHKRHDGATGKNNREWACEMLIAVDEPLFQHYQRNLENTTSLVKDMVERLNEIYHRTVFRGHEFGNIYFRVKEVRILFDFCTSCNQTQQVYLKEFSRMDFSDFCLAHVFTYRDFPAGVQGLAWKGTVCERTYNTGFTTLVNHQVASTRADSAMTFAHEVGHNFGSDHDEEAGCSGNYIMSSSGSNHVKPQFSYCSTEMIENEVREVRSNQRRFCFKRKPESDPDDFSICGNEIVEGDEECDCGYHYQDCYDPCCYSAHISPADLELNRSATPCRSHRSPTCLRPFGSLWTFGFVVPWIFILLMAVLSTVGLVVDWKRRKHCYTHITKPEAMIRSETAEQMAKRIQRQSSQGKVYVIASPNGEGPPRPEAPNRGLVQQMKDKIERNI